MKFYFHPRADNELNEAVQYYENCQGGLGLEFAEEVYAAIGRISEYPDAWAEISMHTRRCLLNRFPYVSIKLSEETPPSVMPAIHVLPAVGRDITESCV